MTSIARQAAQRRKSVRIGVGTLIGATGVTLFALTAQNGMPAYVPGVERTELSAVFNDTGALRAGDDVRIANVRSGFVESIELEDGEPVVTMQLDEGREVYEDASVTIGARSSLGQKYVELDPGSEDAGELTGTIPVERTRDAVELDHVLATLDPKTRRASASALRQGGGGLAGRGDDLNAGLDSVDEILRDLGTTSEALAADDGAALSELLITADTLATRLSGQQGELATLTTDLATTMEAVATDDGAPLGRTLEQAPGTLRDVRGALTSLNGPLADTEVAARALLPGARALERAMPDTRGLLREAVPPLERVPEVAELAEPAVTDLTGTVADARPVVGQLRTLTTRAEEPLDVLAPYSGEVALFFENAASALAQGNDDGHWLRFYVVGNPETVTGNLPIDSPLEQREPYPAPGEAEQHRTNDLQVIP